MTEKLTIEGVLKEMHCDCSACQFAHNHPVLCEESRHEHLKNLIMQIFEQVKPDILLPPFEEDQFYEQRQGYNSCIDEIQNNIKRFLDGGK